MRAATSGGLSWAEDGAWILRGGSVRFGAFRHRGKGLEVSVDQKRARWFGVLYLITFVTSIPALVLYEPALRHPVAFHRGRGERQQDLPRRAVGAAADHREHRNRGRDRPDHEAAVRGAGDRLRDGEDLRVHVHSRRHRRDARDRHLAARECGRGRRHGRVHAGGDQGLDVHPRAGLGGRLGERVDPGLHDVSHAARAAAVAVARA